MLFNSPEFIVFFIIVYFFYLLLPFRLQNYMLLIATYVFYGWWDTRFLFLVALSTTIDFWVGLMLENGHLTLRQQLLPAAYLAISALLFLGFKLDAFWSHDFSYLSIHDVVRIPAIGWAAAGIAGFLTLMYFLYWALEKLKDSRQRRSCLTVSLVTQLGLLGVFKYYNFFMDNLTASLNSIGIETSALHLDILLPVGVSFYTFQSLSYTIDIYRQTFKPTDRFFDFALFVGYFPQLQAGPIERARHLLPQISKPRSLNLDQSLQGLFLILSGFFKKVGIADGVAPVVDHVFNSSGRVSWIDVVAATALFAVQIYCDFSGYTDIARGTSKLFGIDLIINFNQPYFATNPQDFWRRWHISLSTWLRDYLYIPLGGNRGGTSFICRNIIITMLLGGLWHGAAWNFVLWGFYQGVILCIHRVWTEWRQPLKSIEHSIWRVWQIPFFFVVTCYGWLLFRAHSFGQIAHFTSLLISDFGNLDYGAGLPKAPALLGISLLFIMEAVQFVTEDPLYHRRLGLPVRGFVIAAMIAIILMGSSGEPAQFIYFQF